MGETILNSASERNRTHADTGFFPARPQKSQTTWRGLLPLLALALACRIAMAIWGDVPLHPDEIFQYYEQAHRLVYGYGFVPWEYVYGVRSWLIPLAIAAIMPLTDILAPAGQVAPTFVVRIVFSVISLILPWGMYRLTQKIASERAAIWALFLGCFWHHFLFLGPKPVPDALAVYGLIWLCVWVFDAATPRRVLAFGIVSGLVIGLRYQLVPVVGILNLCALWMLGRAYLPAFLGNLLVLVILGLIDLVFWGGFLSSFVDNFRLNLIHDVASDFGRQGILFYSGWLAIETGGLVLPGMIGVAMIWRRTLPVICALFVGFALLHIPAHKEFRFVLWLVPFFLVATAVLADFLARRHAGLGLIAPVILAIWAGTVTLIYVSKYTGMLPYKEIEREAASLMLRLAQEPGLSGVEIRAPSLHWFLLPGYAGFHRPVPIVFGPDPQEAARGGAPDLSHMVTESSERLQPPYVQVGQVGRYVIWRNPLADVTSTPNVGDIYLSSPDSVPPVFDPFGTRGPITR